MAATTLTITNAPGLFSQTGVAITMAAADVSNGNDFVANGTQAIVAHNSGASTYTVTITSVADPVTGRTGNVAAQNVAAGEIRLFLVQPRGWADGNGKINLSASNVAVKFGVINL